MDWYWLLAMMLFCHIIEDFHIQGILADMKQKCWWRNQYTEYGKGLKPNTMKKYDKDYAVALLMHGFEWAFIVHIPLMWFVGLQPVILLSITANALVHAYIDNMKCNRLRINLIQDQILHIVQIAVSLAVTMVIV